MRIDSSRPSTLHHHLHQSDGIACRATIWWRIIQYRECTTTLFPMATRDDDNGGVMLNTRGQAAKLRGDED